MLDLGMFGHITFDLAFLSALFSIVIIDLILAGDNAVVIAMAVRSLPPEQRKKGIIFGSAAAVVLRVILTFFVAQLLQLNYVKLAGGALILWIAVKLFMEGAPEDEHGKEAKSLWMAVKIIVIADITMALDNMLAVGGASHGNLFLLIFGLGLSIPFIVFTSNLLSMLMDKYPVIIYIGAAILGKVGGEMMITDPFTIQLLPASLVNAEHTAPLKVFQYSIEALFAAGVIVVGKLWMKWKVKGEKEAVMEEPAGKKAAGRPGAILTISREFGSGGREIGQAAARELGYAYVDREAILADIKKDGGKWEEWARNLDEHCPTVWEKYDWSFRGFAALVQKHILEQAAKGGVVLMGRGGNFLLKDIPHAFRIRVQAPLDLRMERIVKRESVDTDTARWLCEKTDNERSCFLHTIYGKRWDDSAEYDQIFDAGTQTMEAIIADVVKSLREREGKATDEARRLLSLRAAAAKVKAGIATNSRFFIPTLDVSVEGAAIVLRGVTHSPKEHTAIEEAAAKLAGDVPVRCELHYRK
jgi:YjbE family integral membrane protein